MASVDQRFLSKLGTRNIRISFLTGLKPRACQPTTQIAACVCELTNVEVIDPRKREVLDFRIINRT